MNTINYQNIRIEAGFVTPKEADNLLNANTENRNITPSNVARIRADIENGDFTWSNDMICVCEDGLLLNGQHRLKAISESGVPTWLTIAYNVPRNSVIDKGKPRSDGEQLKIMGVLDEKLSGTRVMATVRSYLKTKSIGNASVSMQLVGEFTNKYGDNLYLATLIAGRGSRKARLSKAAAQAVIFAALEIGYSEDELIHFAEIANSGFGAVDKRDNAALAFVNTYLEMSRPGSAFGGAIWFTKLVEKALWDYLSNKAIKCKRYNISKLEGHPILEKCEANVKNGKVI